MDYFDEAKRFYTDPINAIDEASFAAEEQNTAAILIQRWFFLLLHPFFYSLSSLWSHGFYASGRSFLKAIGMEAAFLASLWVLCAVLSLFGKSILYKNIPSLFGLLLSCFIPFWSAGVFHLLPESLARFKGLWMIGNFAYSLVLVGLAFHRTIGLEWKDFIFLLLYSLLPLLITLTALIFLLRWVFRIV